MRLKYMQRPFYSDNEDRRDLDFPAPVWGNVLNYLPYEDVRSNLMICKMMANEASGHVDTLNIFRGSELYVPAVRRRFPNIKYVRLFCFATSTTADSPTSAGQLALDAMWRVVPFLSSFEKRLEEVFFGGYRHAFGMFVLNRPPRNVQERIHAKLESRVYLDFLDSFLAAIKAGGLVCPRFTPGLTSAYPAARICAGRKEDPSMRKCRRCRDILTLLPGNHYKVMSQSEFCLSTVDRMEILHSRPEASQYMSTHGQSALLAFFIDADIKDSHVPSTELSESSYWKELVKNTTDQPQPACIHYLTGAGFKELDRLLALGVCPPQVSEYREQSLRSKRWEKDRGLDTFYDVYF